MQFSLTIGWWIAPALITIGFFTWAFATPADPARGSSYAFTFPDPMPIFRFAIAILVSLLAWLAWALILLALR